MNDFDYCKEIERLVAKVDELESENKRLTEKLNRVGEHNEQGWSRAKILASKNKRLQAVVDTARNVKEWEHCGGWKDYVPGLLELQQGIAELDKHDA